MGFTLGGNMISAIRSNIELLVSKVSGCGLISLGDNLALIRWLRFCFVVLILTACRPSFLPISTSSPIVSSLPIAFERNSSTVIMFAEARSSGGPPWPTEYCNYVPELRIWGDGRVVISEQLAGSRQVRIGHVDEATKQELLQILIRQGFFSWTPEYPNPAATGFKLQTILQSGKYGHAWNDPDPPEIYKQILVAIGVDRLNLFVPQNARLMATSDTGPGMFGESSEWPARFGITLQGITGSGVEVSGDVLAFAWQMISEGRWLFKEGNTEYVIWLQVPAIFIPDKTFGCP